MAARGGRPLPGEDSDLNDAVTVIRGAHTLKAGFGFNRTRTPKTADVYSQYIFRRWRSIWPAKAGNPLSYVSTPCVIGLPGAWYHAFFWNWFAQDSFPGGRQQKPAVDFRRALRRGSVPRRSHRAVQLLEEFRNTEQGLRAALRPGPWSVMPKTVVRASFWMFYEPVPTKSLVQHLHQ